MAKLKANMNVAVNFEPVYHKLTYKPDNEAHGTLKANYVTDGTIGKSFGSGANIHIEQKVRLTADSGSRICSWIIGLLREKMEFQRQFSRKME